MNRVSVVFVVGACVAVAGVLVALSAGSLATNWQRGDGGSIGFVNSSLRGTYQTIGLCLLCAGLSTLVLAAWRWMSPGGKFLTDGTGGAHS
jgi:hypothetical protein